MSTEEISQDNTHEQNIKVALDAVLGGKTTTRKAKKTAEDKRKEDFINLIISLEAVDVRDYILKEDLLMDLGSVTIPYDDIIESLLSMVFKPGQINIINFYLYSRVMEDGSIIPLESQAGELIYLKNPEELYTFIQTIK